MGEMFGVPAGAPISYMSPCTNIREQNCSPLQNSAIPLDSSPGEDVKI